MAADWSQLPKDILQLISQRLNSEVYLIRFHSVCSSWRQSFVPNCHHSHLPSKLPHFSSDKINYVCGFSKQKIFLIKPPPTNLHKQETPLRPWLIKIGTLSNGKPYLWHPFDLHQTYPLQFDHHLIDFNQLSILHLRNLIYVTRTKPHNKYDHYQKAVVATCEMGQPLALLTYDDFVQPKFLRSDTWTIIPTISGSMAGDICLFKGRPCVADMNGRTLMIGPEDSSVCLLANPVFGGSIKFLVESECKTSLLLVDCHGIYTGAADKYARFDVFRLDEKEKKWIKLTTLGDMVLFLGEDGSFSVSASDLKVPNGNCLIYRRNFDLQDPDVIQAEMRIFHLDQGRVSYLSDHPDYMKLFWPPPKWIPKRYNYSQERVKRKRKATT